MAPDSGQQQFDETPRTVPDELAGKRLDVALATLFPDFSRSRLQTWLKAGTVHIFDARGESLDYTARSKVTGGETITLGEIPAIENQDISAEPVPLDIVFEDQHIIVINKPANLVMHPAAGNRHGTVQNGLLHYDAGLQRIPRAGIVHRLDKDTTGLFVVARSLKAHQSLVSQLADRSMGREYTAIVQGCMVSGGTVDAPLGRHPKDRKRQAVRDDGRSAVTHYRVVEKFRSHAAISVKLESGRTHQIRVHMAHLKHPLVGDATYGGRNRLPAGFATAEREWIGAFARQALHAHALQLVHPESGKTERWEVAMPADMQQLLEMLRAGEQSSE